MKRILLLLAVVIVGSAFMVVDFYPIDGYKHTGIKRLKYWELVKSGEITTRSKLPEGALKSYMDIELNLVSRKGDSLNSFLQKDPVLQKEISRLFRGLDKSYSLAVLDMSNIDTIRYASRREASGYQPGSVGKLAVLTGLFYQLANIYPHSFEKRLDLLRNKSVKSGNWGLRDIHTIPIYDIETKKMRRRQVIASDVFTLFEWTDHMVSPSNNGAASIVWREVLLMAAFKDKYPALTQEGADSFFSNTPRKELTDLGNDVVNLPLRDLGITADEWRLGTFFTRGARKYVGAKGGSRGTPLGLMKFLIKLEQGNIVDQKSSLEMKRLMYMTGRRIRYARASVLKKASVYFKSGSLYKCDRVKDENCGKYRGNVYNYMNSVAIIEQPDSSKYIVALMTNVLSKNSASDHLRLASKLDKIIRE